MHLSHYHRAFLNLWVILICCTPQILSRHLQTDDINAQLVTTIESYMNATKNPCEDFYGYACENWKNEIKYEAEAGVGDSITSLDYEYNQQLKQLLEGEFNGNKIETQFIFNKLRDFYDSCRKQKDYNITEYLELFKPTASDEWPEDGETWNPREKWNVWSTMGRLAAVGFNHLFFDFNLNQQPDSSYAPYVYGYELDYPQWMYLRSGKYTSPGTKAALMADKMDSFGHQLREVYFAFEDEYSKVKMTIAEYQQQSGAIVDLHAYLSAFLGHQDVDNITVHFQNIDYIRKLAELVEATPHDVLIHSLKQSFIFYLEKKQLPTAKWDRTCVHAVRQLAPLAADYLYDQLVYEPVRQPIDAVIEKVFRSMQQKFVAFIQEHSDELSPQEIESLQDKALKMKLNIGNLPQGVDDKIYLDYFQNWQVVKDNFTVNHLNALKWFNRDSLELLKLDEFSPLRLLFPHSMATPLYLHNVNVVGIPYAYIRYPMIHAEFHELFLYAELGNSIGHEILHGFDTYGINIDAEGKERTMSIYDKPKFANALGCLKQQRTLSINEKIADFSGFRLAYETYFQQSHVPVYSGKSKLANKQLYFVKFAQLFCSKPYLGYDGSHDIPSQRVPQVVRNNPDFEEVFSCPKPRDDDVVKKCQMW